MFSDIENKNLESSILSGLVVTKILRAYKFQKKITYKGNSSKNSNLYIVKIWRVILVEVKQQLGA